MKFRLQRTHIESLSLFILIVGIIITGFFLSVPPRVVPENAPLNEFSAVRAMKHLHHIAEKPHMIGTDEHLKVRNYIIKELEGMGVRPELQMAELVYQNNDRPSIFIAATLGNIIVKIPGKENGKAVLVMGHYDSVESSYGASDNGTAVVTMLETIRLLLNQDPLKNDIIFLFTDGEEVGLLGATAFLEQHPLASQIGMVLNFEASGTSGPSIMFETSADNRWLISEFAEAAPYPNANSLSYEIYRNMPNDTDLTPFKKRGIQGLNFAYIDNRFDYHTGGDNIENTSLESLQHHGSYAAALTRHFGNLNLDNYEKGDAVYFNAIGNALVHYSYSWILPFIVLTCLALLLVLVMGWRKKLITPIRLLFGFFAFIIHLVIAPAIVTCLYIIMTKYYQGNDFMLLFYNQKILLTGFVAITVAVAFGYYKLISRGIRTWHVVTFLITMMILLFWSGQMSILTAIATVVVSGIIWLLFRKPTGMWELSLGSFIGWTILMIVVSILMPGVSYLFTWPLLFSIIPVGFYFFRSNQNRYSLVQTGLFLIFSLPVLLWFSEVTYLFLLAMGLKMAGVAVLLAALGLTLLIPHIDIITRVKPGVVPVAAILTSVVFILYGSVNLKYSERYRKPNSLIYATNGNTNETFLSSYERETDEWTVDLLTSQPDTAKLGDFFTYISRDIMKKTVNTEPLQVPILKILHDSITDNNRIVQLHLNSARKANTLLIQIKGSHVSACINHSELKALTGVNNTDWNLIRYHALPHEGIVMELKFPEEQSIEICLTDIVYGLPQLPGMDIPRRPGYMMANGDKSLATKTFFINKAAIANRL